MKYSVHALSAALLTGGLLTGCLMGGGDAKEAKTVGLMTDQMVSPANVAARPSFSWRMESARTGAAQTAYQVKVFEGVAEPKEVWDSGEVADGRSVGVRYAGPELKSAAKYMWKVRVKDETGAWLEPAKGFFETGLFRKSDWNGSVWISAADASVRGVGAVAGHPVKGQKQEAEDGTACFVRKVANLKDVAEAYWSVAGLGVFEAYVNGKPVSRKGCRAAGGREVRDFLKPGFTQNQKTKYAFTYDVTHLLKQGKGDVNVFAAQVSSGWWRDKIVNFVGKKSAFRGLLILRHVDGTETRIGTDTSWLAATTGPVVRAAIFDGEDYDARAKTDWMTGAPDPAFRASEVNVEFKGDLLPSPGAQVRLREDLSLVPAEMYVWKGVTGADAENHGTVVKLRTYKDGDAIALAAGETLVVDFAQNAAAVPDFVFAAKAGTTLTAKPAEMLNDANGAKKRGNDGPEGSAYRLNLRQARATMNYTFAGADEEAYHPEFTFFGYRYLSVTATDTVTIRRIRSVPVTSILPQNEAGMLETDHADLNRLVQNVRWGQYSNYLSVPTDCPQRNERLGWMADTQVFCEAATYNANVYAFFVKWMRDVVDTQKEDGSYTGVSPTAQYGSGRAHQLGWSDAGVIVPYTMWRQYGDTRIVEACWDSMMRFLKVIDATQYASPEAQGHQWADWLSYEKLESCGGGAYEPAPDGKGRRVRPDALVYWKYLGGCYWLWDARMMAQMASALGRKDDLAWLKASEARALAYLRKDFVAPDGQLIPLFRDMQTPALFALKLGILEKSEAVAATKAALRKNFEDHGNCLQTGFLGTSILMDTLTNEAGMPDMAYTLLLQHKNPSWLYSVDQGATTIWERWNSYVKATGFGPVSMNSFNHYAYGAVLAWMYGTMAGIQENAADPGFRHIVLAPVFDRRVGRVKAEFRSPYGPVASAWSCGSDGKVTWTFTIPANTTATVKLPGEEPKDYVAGTYTLAR
ncbi:MAG: family 78 glycoside hydrolase catalytic domain [Kiritimatiellae bacterium]|nr:family 78 glycoside hydrolase catalytic domain [Kiritimatiellia bacterium]